MDELLMGRALNVVGGTALFRLVETANAEQIFEYLASASILVRGFPNMRGHLRFGLPGRRRDWERLRAALEARRRIEGGDRQPRSLPRVQDLAVPGARGARQLHEQIGHRFRRLQAVRGPRREMPRPASACGSYRD